MTDPECRRVYTLTHQLHPILRYRRGEALTAWLAAAEATKIPKLVRFTTGIRHDEQAVRNGCLGHLESRDRRRLQQPDQAFATHYVWTGKV